MWTLVINWRALLDKKIFPAYLAWFQLMLHFYYALERWHIVIDSSVSLSVRHSVRLSLFCPEHNFKTMQGINMKLHRQKDLIKEKRSAQEP